MGGARTASSTFLLVNYRLFQPGDFEQLYAIEETCFEPLLRFPRTYIHFLINNPATTTWVAEESGQLTGFAIVVWDEGAAYIETIEVAANHRRKGIGAELLSCVGGSARKAGAQTIWLHVDAENASAIRLYETHGYQREGREDGYYPNGHPALIYAKPIDQPAPET